MNVLDRKFVSILKTLRKGTADGPKFETLQKELRELRSKVSDGRQSKLLDSVFKHFATVPEKQRELIAEEAADIVRQFRDADFVMSSAWLFFEWRSRFLEFPLERIVPIAPNAAGIEVWRKANGYKTAAVEESLLAEPTVTYATAGADWLLLRSKPQRLLSLLDLFLTGQVRPTYLSPWADALTTALKKDKRGVLLDTILRNFGTDEERVAALAEAVRRNRTSVKVTVEVVPTLLSRKDAVPSVVTFLSKLFATTISTEGAEREFMTGALARVGSGILMLDRRGELANSALDEITQTVRQLRSLTKDEELKGKTWLLENLQQPGELIPSRVNITLEGARHLALAFEKAVQGFGAKEILSVMARNLGMVLVGQMGEIVSYNPLQHEDTKGGLLPGDRARIEEPGWACGNDVVLRAKVGGLKEENCV